MGLEFQDRSILHDLRNLLHVIQALSDSAQQLHPSSPEMVQVLEELDSTIECATQISRAQPSRGEPTNLSSLLFQATALARRSSPSDIHVELDCPDNELCSIVDRVALIRVLLEICSNAVSAMPAGGLLQISLESIDLGVETPAKPKLLGTGRYAVVEICDSGEGMSANEVEASFKPGFTSRVEHSGLGLATASEAMGRQDGGIRVMSEPGVGTRFQLFLPLEEASESRGVNLLSNVTAGETSPAEETPQTASWSIAIIRGHHAATAIQALLEGMAPRVECFDSPEHYFQNRSGEAACIVSSFSSEEDATALLRILEERNSPSSLLAICAARQAGALARLGQHRALSSLLWPASGREVRELVRSGLARYWELIGLRREILRLRSIFKKLTARELEVLGLIRDGHSTKSIAGKLHLSKRTIDDHRRSLLRKTEADSMATLVRDSGSIEILLEQEKALVSGEWRPHPVPAPLPPAFTPERTSADGVSFHPVQHASHPSLARLGQSLNELEECKSPACVLDSELNLIWTNPAWQHFAIAGNARDTINRRWGLGSRYIDAILPPLRNWYAERLENCIEQGEQWRHEYECPTANSYRVFGLSVDPAHSGLLMLVHSLILERPHQNPLEVPRSVAESPDAGEAVQQCMVCRRSRMEQAENWTLIKKWVSEIPAGIGLTLCSDCATCYPGLDLSESTLNT
ncbi:MAG: FixJ family two-component response regulator/two-component sensor histidine kinase [Planctomycetota bacterium]|jgi:FixJ family two-component response regulator/two-component sensor histidine kinase